MKESEAVAVVHHHHPSRKDAIGADVMVGYVVRHVKPTYLEKNIFLLATFFIWTMKMKNLVPSKHDNIINRKNNRNK